MSTARLRPVRSALFVPANRESWVDRSPRHGADVVVLDLEDATPEREKPAAREIVSRLIPSLGERGQGVWVRINDLGHDEVEADLAACCRGGLEAVALPKVEHPDDVSELDRLLTVAEGRNGLPPGTVRIVPLLETASAIVSALDVFRASPRVAYGGGLAAEAGDVALSVGFRWTDTFRETFVLRSNVLLAARACGIDNPVTGLVAALDVDQVERFAAESRTLGYAGMFVIHPSHVPIANRAFSPSEQDVAWAEETLAGYAAAERAGRGAYRDAQGRMIDLAQVRVAERILDASRRFAAGAATDG